MDSILTSVKKMLGITEDYEHFDADIVMHINSTFMILQQLGVGPAAGYLIQDKSNVWSEFLPAGKQLELVKSYMFMKVKLMFDISTMTSPLIEAYNKQIAEFEWRLNVQVDPDDTSEYEDMDILDILYKNAVKNGYTGTKEEWIEKFNGNGGSGGGDASLKDDLIASIAAGGIKIGDRFVQGEELEALWRALLDPVKNPTLIAPSVSITASGGTLMEKGDTKDVTFIVNFNRGSINPSNGTTGFRSGEATSYTFNGVTNLTDNHFVETVSESNGEFVASVDYAEGEQPKNSKGGDYDAPLPAGTVSSPVLRFEFVDALWSNAADITRIVKEPLISKSAKTKIFEFAPQTKVNPEVFDVPASWNVTKVEVFNEITRNYEDDAREFDISTTTHLDAAGNEVEYKRYTDNRGYAADSRKVKITWA